MDNQEIVRLIKLKGDSCWDSVGIFGEGTCEILSTHEHCRSCPVYQYSGRQLFNRSIPQKYKDEWTLTYSQTKEIEEYKKLSIVLFRIADEWFALDTKLFQEALAQKKIHYIPGRTNKYLYGVINVNGELLLSIVLSSFLGINEVTLKENEIYRNLLVLNTKEQRYCFPVDEFDSVTSINVNILEDIPATVSKKEHTLTEKMFKLKKRTYSLLNADKLIDEINRNLTW